MTDQQTFGTLTYQATTSAAVWVLDVDPDAAIDAKRNLRQCKQTASGPITVDATDDAARTLDWLMMRWPLHMTRSDRRRLNKAVRAHKQRERHVFDILSGHTPPERASTAGFLTAAMELRDYQRTARDLVLTSQRLLLADELGLGKTFMGLSVLADPQYRPALAVTLTNLPTQWDREAKKLFPDLRTHIAQKATPYDLRDADGREPDLLIMNYHKLAGWQHHLAGTVRTVLFDEVHELRRDSSDKYVAAKHISGKAQLVVGMSATPITGYGGEVYPVMDAIAPGCLGSATEFGREWCIGAPYGLDRKTRVADPKALRARLRRRGLMLRRTRQDVGLELPPIRAVEQYVPADLDVIRDAELSVAEVARIILANNSTGQQRWTASGELDWKMRQATGIAKAPFVAAFVKLLLETERCVVLFAWHREVHSILMAALAEFSPMLYTGTESGRQKEAALAAFHDGRSRVLIMSLRSGAGLDGLQDIANVCVFAELDWAAGIHKQCIGRLGRPGQTRNTLAYFCVSDSGSDPIMLDVLNIKAIDADELFDPSDDTPPEVAAPTNTRITELAQTVLQRTAASVRKAS